MLGLLVGEPDPSAFESDAIDPEADGRNLVAAEADIVHGRIVSDAAVRRWLGSWGTPGELPRPQCGDRK
jgi:hypothetical protein